VRVSNMSAFPGEPAHLSEWLHRRQGAFVAADQFITRETYGEYIGSLLEAEAGREGARRLLLLRDEARALERTLLGVDLELASGARLSAKAAVLAIGPLPARPMFPVLAELPPALYAPDPWAPVALADVDPRGLVVLVGAGLTMVDMALALSDQGHRGPILALSRRGLAPLTHAPVAPARKPAPVPELVGVAALVHSVRGRAQEAGWRQAVDELRPFTQALWRGATLEQKRRFLRHLRPWWDSHRHRMAPGVARRIEDMRAEGQLSVRAGRIVAAEAREGRALLTWRPRGERLTRSFEAVRVVDCTGFNAFDLDRIPLLRSLVDSRLAQADALGLGLDVDAACRLIGRGGGADKALRAVGPLTRGAFWEIIAVPDIRNQVASMAADLAAALGPPGVLSPEARPAGLPA